MPQVSLNVDLGELPGEPEALYALATVVNIACGGHAGDDGSMQRASRLALHHGALVFAHPSYEDREGFGRVSQNVDGDTLREAVKRQCADLKRHTVIMGMKPHGALYHDAARSLSVATAVLEGTVAALGRCVVVGPPQGHLRQLCTQQGLTYRVEGFADRGYSLDGTLIPRGQSGAVLEEPLECAHQAVRLAREGICETVCVHGDQPNALAVLNAVRNGLLSEGFLEENP